MGKGKRLKKQRNKNKNICPDCGSPLNFEPFNYDYIYNYNENLNSFSYQATPFKEGLTKLFEKNTINICVANLIKQGKEYSELAIKTNNEIQGYMRNFCFDVAHKIVCEFSRFIETDLQKEIARYNSCHDESMDLLLDGSFDTLDNFLSNNHELLPLTDTVIKKLVDEKRMKQEDIEYAKKHGAQYSEERNSFIFPSEIEGFEE